LRLLVWLLSCPLLLLLLRLQLRAVSLLLRSFMAAFLLLPNLLRLEEGCYRLHASRCCWCWCWLLGSLADATKDVARCAAAACFAACCLLWLFWLLDLQSINTNSGLRTYA
jgi:hypothetical protein